MKKIKRTIIAVLTFALALMIAFSVSISAEEGETIVSDGDITSSNPEQSAEEDSGVTLFGRVWEAFTSEKSGFLDRSIDIVILVAFAVFAKITSSIKNKVSSDIANLCTNNSENAKTQSEYNKVFVGGINTLADEVKSLAVKLEGVIQNENTVASLITIDMTLLEIMTTIYPNAKLPQGIKDIVAEKYANCLKIVNSDEKLSAIVNAIHNAGKEVISNDIENKEKDA